MALANITQLIAAGFERAYVAFLDSDGYFAGTVATGLVAGATGQGMYKMGGVKTANIAVKAPAVENASGDDIAEGAIILPPNAVPEFDIQASIMDLTLDALLQSTTTFNIANFTAGAYQPNLPTFPDFCFLGMQRAKSKATTGTTSGSNMWNVALLPKCNIVPLGTDGMAERKVSTFRYHVIANPSAIWPTGLAFGASNFNTSGSPLIALTSPNRVAMYGWKNDGATTVFNLPKAGGYTLTANTGVFQTYREGTALTATVNISADPQTFTVTAGVSGNRQIVIFEHTGA